MTATITTGKDLMVYRTSNGRSLIAQKVGRRWNVYFTGRGILDPPEYVERDITKAQARGWFDQLMLADLRQIVLEDEYDDDYLTLEGVQEREGVEV